MADPLFVPLIKILLKIIILLIIFCSILKIHFKVNNKKVLQIISLKYNEFSNKFMKIIVVDIGVLGTLWAQNIQNLKIHKKIGGIC